MPLRLALPALLLFLASALLRAQDDPAQRSLARILAQRPALGLDDQHQFRILETHDDPLGGSHTRLQQLFRGVRVWGGEAIVHWDARDRERPLTAALQTGIQVETLPSLTPAEALARADALLAPQGAYAHPPRVELVILARTEARPRPGLARARLNAADLTRVVLGHTLAYHVRTALRGPGAPMQMEYLLDAHTGALLEQWNGLRTAGEDGTGQSQYSGTVTLQTVKTAKGYELRDPARGHGGAFGGNTVTNLDHAKDGKGAVFFNAADTWGDGANYSGGSTTNANGQTAAVDAAWGLRCTWDYYSQVHGRDGIDGKGKGTYLRMHYDTNYENAFWDDDCFCMTFGDGLMLKSLESIDVIGHEVSHGVCAATANLDYKGESGGLNESNSDIQGTLVEFHARGGGGDRIGDAGGNWTIGEDLSTILNPKPIRYLDQPSKDGFSPDAWNADLGSQDVHASSGPMNRCFYFLSCGAAEAEGEHHSGYLPKGMAGIGNDKAARIWYRALANYLTSGSDYVAARKGAIRACKELYAPGGPEEQAVWNAFHGVNVGVAWGEKETPAPVQLLRNGDFEQWGQDWKGTTDVIGLHPFHFAHRGYINARFGGPGLSADQTLYQDLTIPADAVTATFSFYLKVDGPDAPALADSELRVEARAPDGALLWGPQRYTQADQGLSYAAKTFDLAALKGKALRLTFTCAGTPASAFFLVDDVSLLSVGP